MNSLELKDLSLGYENKVVVEKLNASIKPGELVGIIGCNGAGKSTLLKSLRGLLPPKSGEVLINGRALSTYKEKELALTIAYLQQQLSLSFDYTCLEIVLTGRYPHKKWWENEDGKDEELARACLEYTGTLELAERPINELSGGQRQRVLVAKILAQETPIVFLDEPTTGLDMVYQEEIFRFAKALAEAGKTVLMVVHELNLAARYCTRLMLIGQGCLLADGEPEKVLKEEILKEAYQSSLKVSHNPETGGVEICTQPSAEELEKKQRLLEKILKKQ